MMRLFVPACIVTVVLASCGRTPQEQPAQEVRFEMKDFRAESAGGCKSDTILCAYYEVSYPVFFGLDSAVAQELQKRIDASVSMGNPEMEGKPMQQIAAEFVKSFEDFQKEMPESGGGWSYQANVNVEVLTDSLLSLSVNEEYYTGGAHGGNGVYFISIKPATGNDFTLEHLLKPGFKEALTKAGEKAFRTARELPDTTSFRNNGFEFPDDKFVLNQNYGFKKEGIVFYYNSYEVAPYAAGPTEVLIPYEEIKDWLKEPVR